MPPNLLRKSCDAKHQRVCQHQAMQNACDSDTRCGLACYASARDAKSLAMRVERCEPLKCPIFSRNGRKISLQSRRAVTGVLKWEFPESALGSAPEGAQGNRGAGGGCSRGCLGVLQGQLSTVLFLWSSTRFPCALSGAPPPSTPISLSTLGSTPRAVSGNSLFSTPVTARQDCKNKSVLKKTGPSSPPPSPEFCGTFEVPQEGSAEGFTSTSLLKSCHAERRTLGAKPSFSDPANSSPKSKNQKGKSAINLSNLGKFCQI